VHETDKETAGGFFGGKTGGILYRTSGTIKNQRRWGNGGFEGVWGWVGVGVGLRMGNHNNSNSPEKEEQQGRTMIMMMGMLRAADE